MEHDYAITGKKSTRNTNYCCIPQCKQYAGEGIFMHLFPKNKELKTKWEVALRMGKPASTSMRVCSKHFKESDYFPSSANSSRHKLKVGIVPSQNLPVRSHDTRETDVTVEKKVARTQRAQLRTKKKEASSTTSQSSSSNQFLTGEVPLENLPDEESGSVSFLERYFSVCVQVNLSDTRQIRPSSDHTLADILCDASDKADKADKCTQVNFLPEWGINDCEEKKKFTLCDLLNNKEALFTFTGIHSMDLLDTLVSCVEEIAIDASTNKKILSVRDRIILTMVKIKEHMTFSALGVLFGVSGQTCTNYFKNMCPMLATVLKTILPFPDQELIRCNLPKSFKNYKHTRIILDCAETPVEKCKCLKCRILTYSQYKKNYTVKFNLGVTPSGLITEISKPYGGRASDKRIVEDSGILLKLDFRDGVMADKGYRIEKQCEENGLDLIRPPFLKKQKQMSREDAIKNAEIARARVHVERVIQRMRQYELLRGTIPWTLAPYIEDVLTIVGGLTNLGPPIMNIDKFM